MANLNSSLTNNSSDNNFSLSWEGGEITQKGAISLEYLLSKGGEIPPLREDYWSQGWSIEDLHTLFPTAFKVPEGTAEEYVGAFQVYYMWTSRRYYLCIRGLIFVIHRDYLQGQDFADWFRKGSAQ
jgi:hypothetical protein